MVGLIWEAHNGVLYSYGVLGLVILLNGTFFLNIWKYLTEICYPVEFYNPFSNIVRYY